MALIHDSAAYDAQMDLMDQIQRVNQKLDALLRRAGLDPAEVGKLPGEGEPDEDDPAESRPGVHVVRM